MNPLEEFKKDVKEFARGERRGIRNPFVIVPVDPHVENKVTKKLITWVATSGGDPPIETILLDEVFPTTDVFNVVTSAPTEMGKEGNKAVEGTLRDNLGSELVEKMVAENSEAMSRSRQVILLLNLGNLYPFTRASELLDELDRLRVKSTIGIPFPGQVMGGKLSFFGEGARHYYPAHIVGDGKQVTKEDLR